jgi:CheY-like chemotaxis protein
MVKTHQILLVDDCPVHLEFFSFYLDRLGIPYHTAQNGQEAIALVKDNEYSMILMDLEMPDMNGFETSREIRKTNPSAIILAVSALPESEAKKKIFEYGINEFVEKQDAIKRLSRTLSDRNI